jgi:hypothetical protein
MNQNLLGKKEAKKKQSQLAGGSKAEISKYG